MARDDSLKLNIKIVPEWNLGKGMTRPLVGYIFFTQKGKAFPTKNWTDFVLVVLRNLVANCITHGLVSCELVNQFMDGPQRFITASRVSWVEVYFRKRWRAHLPWPDYGKLLLDACDEVQMQLAGHGIKDCLDLCELNIARQALLSLMEILNERAETAVSGPAET